MTRHIQTKTEVAAILRSAGHRPNRRHGQNFLIDGNLMRRLIDSAEIAANDIVLEVGCGTGALTEHLVQLAARVVCVEIDPPLHAIVANRLADADNLTLLNTDALANKHTIQPDVRTALSDAAAAANGQRILVANLPYNIATPLLVDLLLDPLGFSRFCFTVQKEVGQRLVATPGTRDFGPVSIALQATCRIDILAHLPPHVFWPPPKIDSVMIRADVVANPLGSLNRLQSFVEFVRRCFTHRRKTLRHNIAKLADADTCTKIANDHDLARRPEQIPVDEWIVLFGRTEPDNPPDV